VIERAVALEATEAVLPERLADPVRGRGEAPAPGAPDLGNGFSLDEHLRATESRLLLEALERCRGDRSEAARLLGVSARSLRYLIQKHSAAVQGHPTLADRN